jgi:predicted  nucleic acid-binding Zn-ribbon protein
MYDQLERLIRLQELDREAARLTRKLEEIAPQIEETRVHLAAAERALEAGKAQVEAARKERRAAEKSLEVQIDKRRKFQDQQGKVKTNKEYQALMGELETLKVEETALEDRILALMEAQAAAEAQLPALTAEVGRERAEFERSGVLRGPRRSCVASWPAQAARAEVVAVLEPDKLQIYQRIAKLRGSAVAEVRDEFCLGAARR